MNVMIVLARIIGFGNLRRSIASRIGTMTIALFSRKEQVGGASQGEAR